MNALQLKKEIRAAIKQGDVDQVKTLIGSSKKRLEMMTGLGTWLNVAASDGNLEIAKHLVTLGADINRRGGLTENAPITTAAWMGHAKTVRYLLSCGAELDVSDRERNPLFNAIEGGYIDIVKMLIDHGIDTRVKYTGEFTKDMDALTLARLQGKKKIAALLAKIGKQKPDYAAFKRALKKAVTLHFAKYSKTLTGDRCNAYCLYTSDDVSSIGPVANRASKAPAKPGKPLYNYYRYSADEWSDWDDFGLFSEVNNWIRQHAKAEEYFSVIAPKLLNVCVDVLAELKIAGLFNKALPDLFLIVWVSDSSNRIMQKSAARLNSQKAYEAYAAEFVSSQEMIEEYIRLADAWGISLDAGDSKNSNRLCDKILKKFQRIVQAGQEEELFERVHEVGDATCYFIAGHMKERHRAKALLLFKRLCRSKTPFVAVSSKWVIKEMEKQKKIMRAN